MPQDPSSRADPIPSDAPIALAIGGDGDPTRSIDGALAPASSEPSGAGSPGVLESTIATRKPGSQRNIGLFERLASQGLFLFRYRSLFTLILLPAAALAIYQRRIAGVGPEEGAVWLAASLLICLAGLLVRVLTLGFVPGGTSGRDTQEPRAQA
jgi:hypothetical protein